VAGDARRLANMTTGHRFPPPTAWVIYPPFPIWLKNSTVGMYRGPAFNTIGVLNDVIALIDTKINVNV
jgi:hypothetical protein